MAPTSNSAASALHPSFGLSENLGKGKLLGGGESVKTEPENFSKSLATLPVAMYDGFKTLGRSLGSGPNGLTDAVMGELLMACVFVASVGFK